MEKVFKGIKVLVDGYNIKLPYGTGIKTYGLTLINTLKKLGAEVGILFDFNFKFELDNPLINSILLTDASLINQSFSKLVYLKQFLKYIFLF